MKIRHISTTERYRQRSPILFTGDYPAFKKYEFDWQYESDGVLYVYVYCSTWSAPGCNTGYNPVRRVPMGKYRRST